MLSRLENSVIKPVESTSFLTMQKGHLREQTRPSEAPFGPHAGCGNRTLLFASASK